MASRRSRCTKKQSCLNDRPGHGVPGFGTYQWYGVFVPSRTPQDIVVRLNRELVEIMRAREVTMRLAGEALIPVGDTPENSTRFFGDQIAKWAKVLKSSGSPAD
jgi:tripartite-type tricarboxylate transporter receptor subunit TctC